LNDRVKEWQPSGWHKVQIVSVTVLRYCRGKIEDHRYSDAGRSNDKWRAIGLYLQKNFSAKIFRESVALEYGISPNHLSRLFREEGGMGLMSI
jgi:AraC-like DNA-binding protein